MPQGSVFRKRQHCYQHRLLRLTLYFKMSLSSSWPPSLHSTALQNSSQQRKRWRREKKQSFGSLDVCSHCGVERAAQEGTTDSVWAEMVRAESPNPQDMEQWKLFSAAVGVITFRRSHEDKFFLSEAAAVCSFSFWSKYFCTRQAESYRSGSGHDGGYKIGMNFRWVKK